MHKVTIGEKTLYAHGGEPLSDVLKREGIIHEHPCGGKGACKKCELLVNGKTELSCQYKIHSDIAVSIPKVTDAASTTTQKASDKKPYALVLDLGSTTLVLALISSDGSIIDTKTEINPQRTFGADVISRIEYCKKASYKPLQSAIIKKLNDMTEEFNLNESLPLFVAGNTVMLHLFFGKDPTSIGVAPYTPKFLSSLEYDGDKLGLYGVSRAISLPSISSFVGADIVSGLSILPPPKNNKYNILIDLGTNAEIVLFSNDKILCTSAAAGPSFEGANISFGMSALEGALCSFYLDEQGNKTVKTVNGKECIGICGTGLIDVVASLLQNELIDSTGYLDGDIFNITDKVSINTDDVRNLALAKSAICSALITLMENEGVNSRDIDTLFISGGFSTMINVRNATYIGLIPSALADRCIPINNSSLLGAIDHAVSRQDLSCITSKAKYIDLATSERFSSLFIKNLSF